MKTYKTLPLVLLSALALSACGGSSDSNTEEKIDTDTIFGPYSTGTVAEPGFVYFDLESMSTIALTDTEAQSNTDWDIAFKRSGVYLNNANTEAPVSAYFTNNNSDFFDENGDAIADAFINATPDTELEDFTLVTIDDVPTDSSLFVSDVTSNIIEDFYNYDSTTHIVTAAPENYFIVNSDETFSKFSVTGMTTEGYYITHLTISYVNQTSTDLEFEATTSEIVVDSAEACAAYEGVYLDFDLGQTVAATDSWDISLSCSDDLTGANFNIDIADDATAIQDFDNIHSSILVSSLSYYDFESNEYTVKAFDSTPWYQYALAGGHALWSQYGVYLIQTETATYKLQITSYYDEDGNSGNMSFRAEAL
ncbi:MAG: HmuY family protein [Colwellia sp.]